MGKWRGGGKGETIQGKGRKEDDLTRSKKRRDREREEHESEITWLIEFNDWMPNCASQLQGKQIDSRKLVAIFRPLISKPIMSICRIKFN